MNCSRLTQWAAAAHVTTLGRHAGAEAIRSRARLRFLRTVNRLALAPFVLDLPSDERDELRLRDQNGVLPVTGVLLAAGHGRRAGGPKALISVDGLPLWQRQVQRLQAIGVAQVVVVLHPQALLPPSPTFVPQFGDPDATPLHSLQRALTATTGPVVVLPVDCPAPSRGVVVRLLAAAAIDPRALAVRPIVQGPTGPRGGHPLWLAAATCQALTAVDAQQHRLDTFLHTMGDRYVDVCVADPAVLGNFNLDGVSR